MLFVQKRNDKSAFYMFFPCQKYDYDSSTVRKKFFREALLQIIIPYMLQHLSPSCSPVSSLQHNLPSHFFHFIVSVPRMYYNMMSLLTYDVIVYLVYTMSKNPIID